MESLVSYGSDDECENERYGGNNQSAVGGQKRRDDDTNYDTVNMDMSEDSESEPELPQAEPSPPIPHKEDRRHSDDSRSRDSDRRRESPRRDRRERKSPERSRRDDRSERSRGRVDTTRRGLLGDRPDTDKTPSEGKPHSDRSHDARDAVSPRFTERRDRDRGSRDRERERDRSRHNRRSEEGRPGHSRQRSRSRPRHQPSSSSNDRRDSPQTNEYRPSYKVNKKLEVMEKMGLQIKTPSGGMATAQQLRAAASEPPPGNYFNAHLAAARVLHQVQKRKMLWANKNKSEAEEAAKWTGTKFSQDQDGKQVSKFMRLMGIKQPEAVQTQPDASADPNKKQEELFQAMQAQYEVARATTHTMRGVGLGFQRGQF